MSTKKDMKKIKKTSLKKKKKKATTTILWHDMTWPVDLWLSILDLFSVHFKQLVIKRDSGRLDGATPTCKSRQLSFLLENVSKTVRATSITFNLLTPHSE